MKTKKSSTKAQSPDALALMQEKLALRERQMELREGLPFLYGWKWYPWAREFYESQNKLNFLCAANQISKSSTQIRKCINWATNPDLWPHLWVRKPSQFWYLYPTANQATAEFRTKWQQFLPRGKFKTEAVIDGKPNFYAWKEEIKNKEIHCIHFFVAGVFIFFKSYGQDVNSLQTGTCDALFCDEELPTDIYDELIFRLSASDGYFHMVFTATLGQEFWRLTIEPGSNEVENLPGAFKKQVSMYDCLFYEDGSPSHWTEEKIQMVKNRCQTAAEILKRVYGRFILDDGGRKYEAFDMKRHMKPDHPLPKDWLVYAAVDVGGGGKAHPGAICFVGVSPDFRHGRIFKGWRGSGADTTAGDIFNKFVELRGSLKLTAQYYDWASKDFKTIASRAGEPFIPAEKSHELGEQVINTLFKNNMLYLYESPEMRQLASELVALRKDTPKNKAKDDFCDAMRYAVTQIPWDWTAITGARPEGEETPEKPLSEEAQQLRERRKAFEAHEVEHERVEDEFEEWNEYYG